MKALATILAVLVASHPCSGLSPQSDPSRTIVAAIGEWQGDKYQAIVELQKVAQHNPERAGVYLSLEESLKIARIALKRLVGDSHEKWHLLEVRFARADQGLDGNASFYYLIRFESQEPALVSSVLPDGTKVVAHTYDTLPFVVYPSGVAAPPQKEPNKAPEPMPGAVTPPATEATPK